MPRNNRKIFVLDTSVILYDYNAIYNFQEHDVAIPISVLEEIDQFKKGDSVINFNAREFIRSIDTLSTKNLLENWIPLNGTSRGKLRVLTEEDPEIDTNRIFGSQKQDHHILNTAIALTRKETKRKVILVTKDVNLRIKARSLNVHSEDYETGKIKNVDHLYTGKSEIAAVSQDQLDRLFEEGSIPVADLLESTPPCNEYFILKSGTASALAFYNASTKSVDRIHSAQVFGVKPRNAEQTFAMHAILNPDVLLVTISGSAGTGKTLLALAGAIEQRRKYQQIYLARPIVPLSNKDIGYLPGDIKSKINPYMQPLWDNLSYIKNQYNQKDKEYKKIDELVETEKLHIVPLAYIRGRSLSNVIFIVDEAQNLTPHEVKTIITRAGHNTKIIFTGDIFQIDTPYLDSQSNGLSYLIDRIKNNPIYAHINLEKGERSELANLASQLL
jgi:PhoH-like ATPase